MNILARTEVINLLTPELHAQIDESNPLVRDCIAELCKEIRKLQQENAKQKVAHYSALEKLKAECAVEVARDKVRIYLPDNERE